MHDLFVSRSLANGRPVLTTTVAKRIDQVWANDSAEALVVDAWMEDLDYATHKTLALRLSLPAFSQQALRRDMPDPLPTTAAPGKPLSLTKIEHLRALRHVEWENARQVIESTDADVQSKRKAVDTIFDVASHRAAKHLTQRANQPWRDATHRRGKTQPLRKSWLTRPVTRASIVQQDAALRANLGLRADKLTRRLLALARMFPGPQRSKAWVNVRKETIHLLPVHTGSGAAPVYPHSPPEPEEVSKYIAQVVSFQKSYAARMKREGLQKWRQRTMERPEKWVTQKSFRRCPMVDLADEGQPPPFYPKPRRHIEKVGNYWGKIWTREEHPRPALEQMLLSIYPRYLLPRYGRSRQKMSP